MSCRLVSLIALGSFALIPVLVLAGDKVCPGPDCAAPVCETTKTVPYNKITLFEEQDLITIPRLRVREVTTRVPTMNVVVEYREEKRCTTIMVVKPHEEERVVTTMQTVPETTVDPCTGKTCISYKEVPICKVVKVQVFETVPETKEYTIRVPVLKTVAAAVDVTTLTIDHTTTAATATRLRMVETPALLEVPVLPCPVPPLPCLDK